MRYLGTSTLLYPAKATMLPNLAQRFLALILFIGSFALLSSNGITEEFPPELQSWVHWIRHRHPEWSCPRSSGTSLCLWPGVLTYKLQPQGAEFEVQVNLLNEEKLALPSTSTLLPRDLLITTPGGEPVPAPLIYAEDSLAVKLPPGRFTVKGRFQWEKQPSFLPAPPSYGLISVEEHGEKSHLIPERTGAGVWLNRQESKRELENITIAVYRKITDGSPLLIETNLRLRVSGGARSLDLGRTGIESAVPVKVESELPYQLTQEGSLALQLSPGEHDIVIHSVVQQPVQHLKLPAPSLEEWPKHETWTFYSSPSLRSVEIQGPQTVSAEHTHLPKGWEGGMTYLVNAGSEVTFNELRRGGPQAAPNNLTLHRELWLNLSGEGATVVDRFQTVMHRDFRLNALPETKVGRAVVNGRPRFLSKDPESNLTGVELREQQSSIEAISQLDSLTDMHAVGWSACVDGLTFSLNLPPSWQLITVVGASTVEGSWLDSWSLLDLFITILLTVASYKLFGPAAAIFAATLLVLSHNEFLAPRVMFIHVTILFVCSRLVPGGSVGKLIRGLLIFTLIVWAVESTAFVKLQFTQLLHPQLQAGTRYRTMIQ